MCASLGDGIVGWTSFGLLLADKSGCAQYHGIPVILRFLSLFETTLCTGFGLLPCLVVLGGGRVRFAKRIPAGSAAKSAL